jgi:hypothetical protein
MGRNKEVGGTMTAEWTCGWNRKGRREEGKKERKQRHERDIGKEETK